MYRQLRQVPCIKIEKIVFVGMSLCLHVHMSNTI